MSVPVMDSTPPPEQYHTQDSTPLDSTTPWTAPPWTVLPHPDSTPLDSITPPRQHPLGQYYPTQTAPPWTTLPHPDSTIPSRQHHPSGQHHPHRTAPPPGQHALDSTTPWKHHPHFPSPSEQYASYWYALLFKICC